MKVNYEGCAICGSTWGDVWAEVEGDRFFFCCETCVVQFRGLVGRVKASTGWERIDSLEIDGDRRGRTCAAIREGRTFRFFIEFNPEGSVRKFRPLEASGPNGAPGSPSASGAGST